VFIYSTLWKDVYLTDFIEKFHKSIELPERSFFMNFHLRFVLGSGVKTSFKTAIVVEKTPPDCMNDTA